MINKNKKYLRKFKEKIKGHRLKEEWIDESSLRSLEK